MRNVLCSSLIKLYQATPFVFMTGDLGFNALEPLREIMGEFFINAGIAEQNMLSVAAGLSKKEMQTWVYSIAPFCYARPYEQIRNDIALHHLAVKIIGNGGGYGYGVMGATHHAIEDYGVLLTLQHFHAFVPAFAEDVDPLIKKMSLLQNPSYLRLGRCERPQTMEVSPYQSWRKLLHGKGPVVVILGPLAGSLLSSFLTLELEQRPEVWVVTEIPLSSYPPPVEFRRSLERVKRLCVVEEHVAHGGLGEMLAHWVLLQGISIENYKHLHAQGYPSGNYGSQRFHRKESGIDPESVINQLRAMEA
ncbi:transketolase [Deltaproteobacteria bacterium TL4]